MLGQRGVSTPSRSTLNLIHTGWQPPPSKSFQVTRYLERDSLAHCSRVSAQWHQLFNPLLWHKVLFRVPQDFSRQGYLVKTLDLHLGNIPAEQRDHIRHCCLHLRTVHLHFQLLSPLVLHQLFEPTAQNGFVGQSIESLEIYVTEFSVIPLILPWLIFVRRAGYLESLQRLTLGNGQALGEKQQVNVEDVLEYLRVFPTTRMLCFRRIPIGESCHDFVLEKVRGEYGNDDKTRKEVGGKEHNNNDQVDEKQHKQQPLQKLGPTLIETYPLKDLDIYPRTISVLSCLLQKTPDLDKLYIRKIGDPEILPIIQQACPKLRNFRYVGKGNSNSSSSSDLGEFGWQTFFPNYPWMESLHFENTLVVDRTLHTVSEYCSRYLRYLTLFMGTKVCTTTLLQVLQSCTALECLRCTTHAISGDLFHHTNRWACLESLQRIQQLPRLETLSIRGSGFMIEALLDQDDLCSTTTAGSKETFMEDDSLPCLSFSTLLSPPPSPSSLSRLCYKMLKDITMPKFEHKVITLQKLKALLESMPRVEYINFHDGYDEEAREWLRVHRPNLDMGVNVW
ncbi:hypothetical protein BGZ65_003159 [Modicella reniformis]|uniref:F-box domain-containing protein n=1 Tax=Modicella reniformis TaxID=1440133 RepID=A0A9P6J324_9FUNG|nr:hypothetical protein BGZ65_003159 [Modicella reniformis]